MTGFVSFVGAGPGDPELLTLKAVDRLRRADAVLYDDLASAAGVLAHARAEAELVAVGKRAGRPSPAQRHVSDLLVGHALQSRRVVRLKSGDSGLFGRLEEELEAMHAAGIKYEIIPGVPSACAAAAALGLPLTRRLAARRVQFVTGHDVSGALPGDLNLKSLADPKSVTALFMGRRTFAVLAEKLIGEGLPPETPAALVEALGGPEERLSRSTVAGLAAELGENPASPSPALILFGALADFGARG